MIFCNRMTPVFGVKNSHHICQYGSEPYSKSSKINEGLSEQGQYFSNKAIDKVDIIGGGLG
jgi:hypothetical protein